MKTQLRRRLMVMARPIRVKRKMEEAPTVRLLLDTPHGSLLHLIRPVKHFDLGLSTFVGH